MIYVISTLYYTYQISCKLHTNLHSFYIYDDILWDHYGAYYWQYLLIIMGLMLTKFLNFYMNSTLLCLGEGMLFYGTIYLSLQTLLECKHCHSRPVSDQDIMGITIIVAPQLHPICFDLYHCYDVLYGGFHLWDRWQ